MPSRGSRRCAIRRRCDRAALMAQGGEFAFVLYAAALAAASSTHAHRAMMTAIVILSMALTPLVVLALDRLLPRARAVAGRRRRRGD
jgi:glutathione-regulated potassium-efflux system protein KefB